MRGQVANKTLKDHIRALRLFAYHVGSNVPLFRINARDAESFVAERLAKGLAMGTVNKDIRTTQKYYLSIQAEDFQKAQRMQSKVLGEIPKNDLTDPKLTHSGQKRAFLGRKVFPQKT